MSEQELREGLRLAVADEPPMDFDLDELVTTAERLVRRRRALVTVGVSTAAVAVIAVTVPVVLGIGGGAPEEIPVAAPPSQSQTPVPPPPTTSAKPPAPTEAQLRQRATELQAYLKTQVPAVVPNAKSVVVQEFGGEATGQFSPGQNYLNGFVKFQVGAVQTAIDVQVRADHGDDACQNCTELPQADGSKVRIQLEDGGTDNDAKVTILSAIHLRADGTLSRVTTYNYDPTTQVKPVYQPNVALTQEQLVRLATDPAVHI